MTVHGAKGLEAPIVILADTMQTPDQSPPLLWPEDGEARPVLLWRPGKDGVDPVTAALRAVVTDRLGRVRIGFAAHKEAEPDDG